MAQSYQPGTLVSVRGREWVVQSESTDNILALRPLAGGGKTLIHLGVEGDDIQPAQLSSPGVSDLGAQTSARLLADAMRLKLRDGAGPFRSLGGVSFEPRLYQYVPLLMALRLPVARLLIADDVGVGKTIEAGMIAAEMLARGEIRRFAVLCPPHLCEQWRDELQQRFGIQAESVTSASASRLERQLQAGDSIFERHHFTVVSLDFIKSESRRNEFVRACPELVIIDEAHARVQRSGGNRQQGFELLKALARNEQRHMLLLTATPHSGDTEGFYNLLSLLKPEFAELREEKSRNKKLRERLAHHFVQRMRDDITNGEWESAPFPARDSDEITYRATGTQFGELLTSVLAYCRRLAAEGRQRGGREEKMRFWTALALMRCVSSSPRAAQAALGNRMNSAGNNDGNGDDVSEDNLRRHVLDGKSDDLNEDDLSPPTRLPDDQELQRLIQLATAIASSANAADDPKLNILRRKLEELITDGYQPIVFCRYVSTAQYIADHLRQKFAAKAEVRAVTGELPPAARAEAVEELGGHPVRILVATDCLSEGVNLQEHFNAAVHYDLSWNPTRHQQREGRIDRFGQKSTTVKTLMLYGEDNLVDGAVLKVILRKAEEIRRELGIYVPLPEDGESLTTALMQSLLLSDTLTQGDGKQQMLFKDMPQEAKTIVGKWEKAKERERTNRAIFAQRTLHPTEVITERDAALEKLGNDATVRRFVTAALHCLDVVSVRNGLITINRNAMPSAMKIDDLLPAKVNCLCHQDPPPQNAVRIHRAHPFVRRLAEFISESALQNNGNNIAGRAGVIFSAQANIHTTAVLLRLRHRLFMGRENRVQLAEEIAVASLRGLSNPEFSDDGEALLLLEETAAANIPLPRKEWELTQAIERIEAARPQLNQLAQKRARLLWAEHQRVRTGVARGGAAITSVRSVEEVLPVEIIGVYVFVPANN